MSSPLRSLSRRLRATPAELPVRAAVSLVRDVLPNVRPSSYGEFVRPFVAARRARAHYRTLSESELRATRSSHTAFVFGSGRSLVALTPEEWRRIGEHDTVAFSEFARQRWVRVDYHLVAEIVDYEQYGRLIAENPLYADTIFLVQEGVLARDSNNVLAQRLLPDGARVFFYRRTARARPAAPSRTFRAGLVQGWNTLTSVTNFALLMGYRRIVLTGADLYDKRYFWLDDDEVRRLPGREPRVLDEPFALSDQIVDHFGRWRRLLEPRGVELLVYNPRSLLARALDVFSWDEG